MSSRYRYSHTQPGYVVIVFFGIITVISLTSLFTGNHKGPEIFAWGPLVPIFLYPSLTVRVEEERLRLLFGPGLIRKSFPLDRIAECNPVRNRFWHGWGIGYSRDGWVFNVSGFGAVELKLDNGKQYRIGSDEPEKLAEAVRSAVSEMRARSRMV